MFNVLGTFATSLSGRSTRIARKIFRFNFAPTSGYMVMILVTIETREKQIQ